MKFALLLVSYWALAGCSDPYTQLPIAPAATISQDWIEIHPVEPLRWIQPVQELSFHIDSPHQRSPQAEVIGQNGERWVPNVESVTVSGKTVVMDVHGFWGEDMYFSLSKGGPSMEPIRTIRIRSNFPLRISNLVWRGYDPAKVKR